MTEARLEDALGSPDPTLPRRRVLAGGLLLTAGLPTLVSVLVTRRDHVDYATHVLLVLALVVAAALVGGLRVGLPGAIAGALALNWFLTRPYGTLHVQDADQLVVLGTYLAVALSISAVVAHAASSAAQAARARAEARAFGALTSRALAEQATLPGVLEQVRSAFGMREVGLQEQVGGEWVPVEHAATGQEPEPDEVELDVPAGLDARLVVRGRPLFAEDRRVLTALAETAATALEGRRLAARAAEAARYEAADRARAALLAAAGHDLRTPLAGVKAAVGSLRSKEIAWSPRETDALLATIEDSADRLQALVDNLLDASRLHAGAVTADLRPTGLAETVDRAVLSLGSPDRIHLDVDETLPDALSDAGLVERIVANLLQNALRYSPAGTSVPVRGRVRGDHLRCDVVDHGPGLPQQSWPAASTAFDRLGDRTPGGLGLGLTVARGFAEAVGATLAPLPSPGGGLTMRLSLPLVGSRS